MESTVKKALQKIGMAEEDYTYYCKDKKCSVDHINKFLQLRPEQKIRLLKSMSKEIDERIKYHQEQILKEASWQELLVAGMEDEAYKKMLEDPSMAAFEDLYGNYIVIIMNGFKQGFDYRDKNEKKT